MAWSATLVPQLSGLNSAFCDLSCMSFSYAFVLFFDDELVGKLCDCVNKRARNYYSGRPKKKGCVDSIIWHPVKHESILLFYVLTLFYFKTNLMSS